MTEGAPPGFEAEWATSGKFRMMVSEQKKQEKTMADHVASASDARTANNAVRHQYRVLTDVEKAQMVAIKGKLVREMLG